METLTVEKTVYRAVTCEHCGRPYGYMVGAKASATRQRPKGGAGLLLDLVEGDERTRNLSEDAYRALEKELNATHRFVACPHCRWYQANMSRACAWKQHAWMYHAGYTFLGGAAIGVVLFLMSLDNSNVSPAFMMTCKIAVPILTIGGAALLVLCVRQMARFNLNAGYPNHLAPFPGEPEAILCRPPNPWLDHGIADDLSGWHVARHGKQSGPYSWNQLYDLAAAGKILGDDHLIAPGAAEWVQARTIAELKLQ